MTFTNERDRDEYILEDIDPYTVGVWESFYLFFGPIFFLDTFNMGWEFLVITS